MIMMNSNTFKHFANKKNAMCDSNLCLLGYETRLIQIVI